MDRRGFLSLFSVFASFPLINKVASASPKKLEMSEIKKGADIGVLYHCDFPQEDRFRTMLRNINNHLSVYDFNPMKIKVVVVAHGPGVKFFMKDLSGSPWDKETLKIQELYEEEKSLSTYGVEYYICNITLQRLKLDPNKLHEFVKIIPSGVGVVGHLQAVERFAYIKVQ
ncbi:MAG: DsrE family protein [Aquificaceae bacterium]|nr:DsrE family protein [Aquificaceae bacterium]MCS7196787.1 DsrE family protein [Aquificaceae bacterium]MDW8032387.1 DsrE family protein [Aquificaceae bacterium]MDW8294309.1 DsrE family protein [Aquificaceae bacterium]